MRQFAVQILLSPVSLKQSLRDMPKAGSNASIPLSQIDVFQLTLFWATTSA